MLASVEAALHLLAGMALGRIRGVVDVAGARTARVRGTEPNRRRRAGDAATTEAVAAVRHQRSAEIETRVFLRVERLIARQRRAAAFDDLGVRVVGAAAAYGWEIRCDFIRIAAMIPVALVVARAGVLIEIAILDARRIRLTGNVA